MSLSNLMSLKGLTLIKYNSNVTMLTTFPIAIRAINLVSGKSKDGLFRGLNFYVQWMHKTTLVTIMKQAPIGLKHHMFIS